MSDLSKYPDEVLKKLIKKMEIEEEEKTLKMVNNELDKISNINIIKLDKLTKLNDFMTYDIYDLFNTKKLPTKYRKDDSIYNPINTALPFVEYYKGIEKLYNNLIIDDIKINEISLNDIVL